LQIGVRAFKEDANAGDGSNLVVPEKYTKNGNNGELERLPYRRWIWPASSEELEKDKALDGDSLYDQRVRSLRLDNAYAECIRSGAAMPFTVELQLGVWPGVLDKKLNGLNGGVDGRGSRARDFYRVAFEEKLFAGIHFLRIDMSGKQPIWLHLRADDLLDWEYTYIDGEFVLLGANLVTGHGRRMTFNTILTGNTRTVVWRKYLWDGKGKCWSPCDGQANGKWPTNSVPIIPWYTDWREPFRSPPPFNDAASIQAQVIRTRSAMDRFRVKSLQSSNLSITGWKDASDSEGNPQPLPKRGSAIVIEDHEARVGWNSIDGGNLSVVAKDVEADMALIRAHCMDPLNQRDHKGEVKALEINLHAERTNGYLEALVKSDMATLTTAARMTAELYILSVNDDTRITMSPELFKGDNRHVVQEVAGWAGAKTPLVSREFFLDVARAITDEIPDELWESELARLRSSVEPPAEGEPPAEE
jgi:hypothetical protein